MRKQATVLVLLAFSFAGFGPASRAAEIVVSGTVVSESNQPVAGAEARIMPALTIEQYGAAELSQEPVPFPTEAVVSDSRGRFQLPVPYPGLWRIVISAPGFLPMEQLAALVESRTLEPARLSPPMPRTLRVRLPDGTPAAGVSVGIEMPLAPERGDWSFFAQRGVTDSSGEVRLPALAGLTQRISAFTPAFAPAEVESAEPQIELTLGAAVATSIEIRDERGRPVRGVLLSLGAFGWPAGLSDAAGRMTVAMPADGELELRAGTADGRAVRASVSRPKAGSGPVVLRLLAPVRYAGTVRDRRTGAPLAEALVRPRPGSRTAVLSDARGAFVLVLPALERPKRFEVSAAGYYAAEAPVPVAAGGSDTLDVKLARRGTLSGIVLDEARRPVAGAFLSIELAESAGARDPALRAAQSRAIKSEADGTFALAVAEGVPYRFAVEKEGFAPRQQVGETGHRVEIVLSSGASLIGQLVDPERRPVPHGRVLLSPFAGQASDWQDRDEPLSVKADDRGRFRLDHVPEGAYRLRAAGPKAPVSPWISVEVPDAGEVVDVGEIVVEPGVRLVGRVLDERDRPLAGVQIRAGEEHSLTGLMLDPEVLGGGLDALEEARDEPVASDELGRFEIAGLRRGSRVSVVVLDPSRYLEGPLVVEVPTEEPLEIHLLPRATVSGEVVDSQGRAMAGAVVRSRAEKANPLRELLQGGEMFGPQARAKSDASGHFELADVVPGEVRISAESEGLQPAEVTVTLGPGEALGGLRLVLESGGVLEGRVVDDAGQGLSPVFVAMVRTETNEMEFAAARLQGVTTADGSFRIAGIKSGKYWVMAHSSESGMAREEVTITAGAQRVELVLPRGATVRGVVVDESGRPVGAAWVVARRLSPEGRGGSESSPTEPDGSFTVRNLKPGRHQISAQKSGVGISEEGQEIEVTGAGLNGVRVVLHPASTLRGRVLGLEPEDWPRVLVRAIKAERGGHYEAPLDREGRFVFSGLAPGDWVLFATESLSGRSISRTVRVEERETEIEIEFDAADAIAARLLLEGRPVAGAIITLGAETGARGMATTLADGRFELPNVPRGSYTLTLIVPDRPFPIQREVTLSPGAELVLDLRLAGVAGRVVDVGTSAPVRGALLRILAGRVDPQQEPTMFRFEMARARSDEAGRFALDAQIEGPYVLEVQAEGYTTLRIPISLAVGLAEMEIPLTRGDG